jgi:hypothetical protein
MIFTEDLSWIESISQNPYVNRGNRGVVPQYISFFNINEGSLMMKGSKQDVVN